MPVHVCGAADRSDGYYLGDILSLVRGAVKKKPQKSFVFRLFPTCPRPDRRGLHSTLPSGIRIGYNSGRRRAAKAPRANNMNSELLDFGLHAFVMLLAVVDPLGNVPFFITMTPDLTPEARRRAAVKTAVISWAVLTGFALGGTAVLWVFRITVPAIQIGGGIILLLIALRMLWGRQFEWQREHPAAAANVIPADPAIVPMAIPITAGPGAMSSTIVLTTQRSDGLHIAIVLAAIVLIGLLTLACYGASNFLMRYCGRSVMVMLSCLMGLILAALAAQFILDGLRAAMPNLVAR